MDKKNLLIGITLLLAAFGTMFWSARQEAERERQRMLEEDRRPAAPETRAAEPRTEPPTATPNLWTPEPETAETAEVPELFAPAVEEPAAPVETTEDDTAAVVEAETVDDEVEIISLANDYIEVDFTPRGGAVESVRFRQTKRGGPDDFAFNADAPLPAMVLATRRGRERIQPLMPTFEVTEVSATHIIFEAEIQENIRLQREYRLQTDKTGDPYTIRHFTRFINNTGQRMSGLQDLLLGLGTALPMGSDRRGEFLSFGYYDGTKARFTAIRHFRGSGGFLGIGSRSPRAVLSEDVSPVVWATVKNQFFVSLINPKQTGRGIFAQPVDLPPGLVEDDRHQQAVSGFVAFNLPAVAAGESSTLEIDWYVGPKEFNRLNRMANEQDKVMQFGFFGFFSKLLMIFMYGVHFMLERIPLVPSNWGLAIVVMTICIKMLFWPLTAKAARSQRKMQKIQAPMKELREKYKDNPQKMQKETMRLFRENQVNPAAGCLPLLIQIPIFIGLFWMLRTAAELRFEPFLWVNDLSRPDTQAHVFGLPINVLPLIMGVTMIIQMRMMPAMATADQMQQKLFKILPLVFLVILYNFSSGLVLYWTVQNGLTILQQYLTNKKLDRLEALEPTKPTVTEVDTDEEEPPSGRSGVPLPKAQPIRRKSGGKKRK